MRQYFPAWGLGIIGVTSAVPIFAAQCFPNLAQGGLAAVLEPYWIAVPIMMGLLLLLLLWGMRRDPRVEQIRMEREIRSDDPPADVGSAGPCGPSMHLEAILGDRRLLTRFWGDDCPDFVVVYWGNKSGVSPGASLSYHQIFLPFHQGVEAAFTELENHFFEGAVEQGIAEGSQFLRAYSFVRLPEAGQDILLESNFLGPRFGHEAYLVDGDGKLTLLPADGDDQADFFGDISWRHFRRALAELADSDNVVTAADFIGEYLKTGACRGRAHAWLARIGRQAGARIEVLEGYLAQALEFAPGCQVGRVERAILSGPTAVRAWIHDAQREIASQTDHDVHVGYLVAQSLLALHQRRVARIFCEQLLIDFPRHPGASRLLYVIDQRERGAQT